MLVNKKRTKILCISDALNYKATCRIEDAEGDTLSSGDTMKVLGYHIDSRPTAHAHVAAVLLQFLQTTSADTLQSFTECTVLPQRLHLPWKKASASFFFEEALFGRWFLAWLLFCALV